MKRGTKMDSVRDYASTAAGVAKTFLKGTAGSGSEKDIDYGPGPRPETKTQSPPEGWYKSYGRYAPKGSSRRRGTKE